MLESGWSGFWENQKQSFNRIMRINTTYFAAQIHKRFLLKSEHKILDYGCGPGLLADYFTLHKIKITGADINRYYLEQSRKNHPELKFVELSTDI
jgi:2-polyprenyl-3-methyl-5-hydroxy-6-metoxy-1,4-benzoquinol methylase